jgi:hypothetical protein
MNSPIHPLAVATDTALASLYGEIRKQRLYIDQAQDRIKRADEVRSKAIDAGREPLARPYGIDIAEEWEKIDGYNARIAVLEAEAAPHKALYAEHRWSRFFLVLNNNGHIHSSTSCTTCYVTTDFGWLPDLSGLTEADAVEQQGKILCSVCFPSAPVEWTNGVSKATEEAKAERAAQKAERLAKKQAKALVPDDIDGGLVIGEGRSYRDRLTTIAAAKSWLTDYFSWNSGYPRTRFDGTVDQHHPSYPPEALPIVAEVYAARIGSTPEAEIEAAKKRAAKRR